MKRGSLGLIETWGFTAAVVAVDTGMKAANVALLGCDLTWPALMTVKFSGDVGAVNAAVSAAGIAAAKVGRVVSTHVIARPDASLWRVFGNEKDNAVQQTVPVAEKTSTPSIEPSVKTAVLPKPTEDPIPKSKPEKIKTAKKHEPAEPKRTKKSKPAAAKSAKKPKASAGVTVKKPKKPAAKKGSKATDASKE